MQRTGSSENIALRGFLTHIDPHSGYHEIKADGMATQIARKGRTVTVEIPEDLLRKANLQSN
jgi:hypothetical protein